MSMEAVDKGHQEWLNAMKTNDAEALGRLVTADVVLLPPHQQPVEGRQGVIDWFASVVKQARTVGVGILEREVIVTGEFAIEQGAFTWNVAPTAGGSNFEDHGNWLAIWQRQSDGAWKVKRNMWNSTLPAPPIT